MIASEQPHASVLFPCGLIRLLLLVKDICHPPYHPYCTADDKTDGTADGNADVRTKKCVLVTVKKQNFTIKLEFCQEIVF